MNVRLYDGRQGKIVDNINGVYELPPWASAFIETSKGTYAYSRNEYEIIID
jgi:hypothetical protein